MGNEGYSANTDGRFHKPNCYTTVICKCDCWCHIEQRGEMQTERALEIAVEAQEQWIKRLQAEVKLLDERNQYLEAVLKKEGIKLEDFPDTTGTRLDLEDLTQITKPHINGPCWCGYHHRYPASEKEDNIHGH